MKLHDPNLFRQQCYIDGSWIEADNKRASEIRNPANREKLGSVPTCGAAETEKAIASASAAFPGWRARTARERSVIMRRWFELCLENQDDLATIMTMEQGKPLAESRGEVAYGAGFIEWFAEEARRVYGDVIPPHTRDRRIVVLKEPIGVAAAITPWNFPIAMITRKAGAALAAGCTIVIKPAPATPFCALALAELAERAGVPKGVLNVITGDEIAIGKTLCASPLVRKLSFTGSTEVGRILIEQCAPTIKKLSLELGGNAPFIVFDDADLGKAIAGVMASKFRNAGQTCVCANRILVQDAIYDSFAKRLGEAIDGLVVGNGMEQGVTIGPLIDGSAVEKVEHHIADALQHGAQVAIGGKRHRLGGTFFQPTMLLEVPLDARLMKEETFGPVAPLTRFKDEKDAIAIANDTEYGLACYFYSRDIGRIWRVAEALEYGMVGINEGIISTEVAPFGGVKQSGIGREGSKYGIDEYLEIKYLCMGGI
ncbi:MAG TPA: NAD-dependent succinate-semialdehyde dehydrogenase [Candidatus Binataceae bacterium]|nr:NAD-dependent succinate-semialdehyde dehydrogenase [Candidatus Binataceae bacterium]